jgi:NAD-specific glutamate dehydrogenase
MTAPNKSSVSKLSSAQRGEDLGRDLDRRLHAVARVDGDHAGLVDEAVRQTLAAGHVGERAAHQPFGRDDRVQRIFGQRFERGLADLTAAGVEITHGRRQDRAAVRVGQALGHTATHSRNERMRRAEVDADGDAPRVRVGRLAGFGDLQQCHLNRRRAAPKTVERPLGEPRAKRAWGLSFQLEVTSSR